MNHLYNQIKNYLPFNEQEKYDQALILHAMDHQEKLLTRENPYMHLTASSWITNPSHDKVLMIYHKIYNSWSWLGGHADGNADLLEVAKKELEEESGIQNYHLVDELPYSLEILTVDGHSKKGQYVSSHLHLNVTYLFEVDEDESLVENEIETKGIKWIPVDDIKKEVSEKWMMDNIYQKLIDKLKTQYK